MLGFLIGQTYICDSKQLLMDMSAKFNLDNIDASKLLNVYQTVQTLHNVNVCKSVRNTTAIVLPNESKKVIIHARDLNLAFEDRILKISAHLSRSKFGEFDEMLHLLLDDSEKETAALDNAVRLANAWANIGRRHAGSGSNDDNIGSKFVRRYIETITQRGDLSILPTEEIYERIRQQRAEQEPKGRRSLFGALFEIIDRFQKRSVEIVQQQVAAAIKSLDTLTEPYKVVVEKAVMKLLRRTIIFSRFYGFVNDFTLRLKILRSIGKRLFYIYPQDDENQGFSARQLFPSLS